jgi:formylmethanofuran dehydrogenase subunit E
MIDPKDYLLAGQQLHGHKCPAMPLGLRAGAAAMNILEVDRSNDGQLLAMVELGERHCAHCFADGIQMITGCTFGKGNIKQLGYGKFGLILIDKKTGKTVRVVPKAEAQMSSKLTPFFKEYREIGIPASQVPDELVEPLVVKVMNAPLDKIIKIGEIYQTQIVPQKDDFDSFACPSCGDMVISKYGKELNGEKVCIPCHNAS